MIHYNVWFSFKDGVVKEDDEPRKMAQLSRPFKEVSATGVHAGRHGLMIQNVDIFIVEIFEELK